MEIVQTELDKRAYEHYPFKEQGRERAIYCIGAIDQQKIDDKELSDALFIQRQMLIEKAVQYIMITPAYAVQPEIYAEGLKKAMMKDE